MDVKFCLIVLASLILGFSCSPRIRRQFVWEDEDPAEDLLQPIVPSSSTTTTTGTTTTTPSPRFTACVNACQSTQEYNPVCGSDGVTYHNKWRLNCARQCGANIRQLFAASCQPVSG